MCFVIEVGVGKWLSQWSWGGGVLMQISVMEKKLFAVNIL